MYNRYLIRKVFILLPGPGECVPALNRVHCVESVWSLLKHDNLGSERAASHQPFLREQLRLFAAVTD